MTTTTKTRTNRFAAKCISCKGEVPAEAGILDRADNGGWIVSHNGTCPTTTPVARPSLPEVPQGHYAVPSLGHNDLDFYRVDRPTEGRWAGYTFVKVVIGGRPDGPVARGMQAGVLARIVVAGVQDAATRYGQEIGRCYACNRHLTDKLSRELGIGPECRSKR